MRQVSTSGLHIIRELADYTPRSTQPTSTRHGCRCSRGRAWLALLNQIASKVISYGKCCDGGCRVCHIFYTVILSRTEFLLLRLVIYLLYDKETRGLPRIVSYSIHFYHEKS